MAVATNIAEFRDELNATIENIGKARTRALLRILTLLQGNIREQIRKKGLINTGNLLNSINYEVNRDGSGEVGPRGVKYAAIQELGGTIRPKDARALTVPLIKEAEGERARNFPDLKFIPPSRSNPDNKTVGILARELANGRLKPYYVLRTEVTIPPKHYIADAVSESEKGINSILEDLLERGLEGGSE